MRDRLRPSAMLRLFSDGLDLDELRREPPVTVSAADRADMAEWFRRACDRLQREGRGTLVIPIHKSKGKGR